jgi:uncharacterized protein YdcH (DUF465 family)
MTEDEIEEKLGEEEKNLAKAMDDLKKARLKLDDIESDLNDVDKE